jgi:hypothetical protein
VDGPGVGAADAGALELVRNTLGLSGVDQQVHQTTVGDKAAIHHSDGWAITQPGEALGRVLVGGWQVVGGGTLQYKGQMRVGGIGCDLRSPQADFLLHGEHRHQIKRIIPFEQLQ